MIKAFLFDLDGTLIDSEPLWCKAMQRYVQSRGMVMTEEYSRAMVLGKAWCDIAAQMRRDYPDLGDDGAKIERESLRHYEALRGIQDIRIPSSIRLLEKLAALGPVAIVSGSTRQQIAEAIDMMGIGGHVRFFIGSEDYSSGKPDPTCFLMAARKLAVQPSDCLVFEDSSAGVRAALAAGMRCVALRRAGHAGQDLSGAHEVLSDLADFRLAAHQGL